MVDPNFWPADGDRTVEFGDGSVEFQCLVRPDRGLARILVAGEFDMLGADLLEARLRDLRSSGIMRIAIDLRRVTFIDLTGARVLLTEADEGRNGGAVELAACSPVVQRLLDFVTANSENARGQLTNRTSQGAARV
jgi:anti-anti-sigma factor